MRKERLFALGLMGRQLKEHGVDIVLEEGLLYDNEPGTVGHYNGTEVRVNTQAKNWFINYLYEFCHFRQDVLETELWTKFLKDDGYVGLMERECERMVYAMNELLDLGIDRTKLAGLIADNLAEYGISDV